MELSKEEVSRVFAMYLGCDCEATDGNDKDVYKVDSDIIGLHQQWSGGVRLRLRTIDQITDAEAIEVAKIVARRPPHYTVDDADITRLASAIEVVFTDKLNEVINIANNCDCLLYIHPPSGKRYIELRPYGQTQYAQYLISIGIAVPLWFGIDHPLNGRNAIEVGIAIQQPSKTV
jgi:hypothetical protein